jgi:hypothetical protein
MGIVDDPLLALIARFVSGGREPDVSDSEFLDRQLKAVRAYVAQFPDAERNARVLEWIEEHAARYRRDWQRQEVSNRLSEVRCADCPLVSRGSGAYCEVHGRWLELLSRFLAGDISSRAYVEDALQLLTLYKDLLKVTRQRHVHQG